MPGKGKKSTQREAEAGAQNLADWKEKNPSGGALRHGAWSKQVRQRYSDKRTTEGKHLSSLVDGLIVDLGGSENLSTAQSILLNSIRSKLIVILQISKHVDMQESIINEKHELIPCLGRGFTTYSESLRRDLEVLFSVKRKSANMSYERALKAIEGGKS